MTTGASATTTGTSATSGSGARALRALRWLPVALLLGVAAAHFALVGCCALHPWLGGGFGMFSTVDERHLRAWRAAPEGDAPMTLPEELEDAAERAEALPTPARLRALAAELAASQPPEAAGAVRVEVWEMRFGPSMEREPRRLAAAEVDPGGR